jgi:hypothetical protein
MIGDSLPDIINWIKNPVSYISITVDEAASPVWGIEHALNSGSNINQTWNSIPSFCEYLSSLETDDDNSFFRPRNICIYLKPEENEDFYEKLGVDPIYADSRGIEFINLTNVLDNPAFHTYLSNWMERTNISPSFRAVYFDEDMVDKKRRDIHALLIVLTKI